MNFRHSTEKLEEIGDPQHTMSYHRNGQAGAVAVSYSTSPMAPHSPSRRYSSGTTSGSTTTSAIGSSTSKFNAYRSTGTSSLLDRPTSFYTSSSSSGLRSSYSISSEYRRSYCAPGRSVSPGEMTIVSSPGNTPISPRERVTSVAHFCALECINFFVK